ncbi:MAG: magnesium/cobalt transporter CorA [Candidatus Omnitrophica bacterium]|nr:magnesium/cobalt transporter CorA [Candidatus Omnitrophota bacterium]
MLSTFLYQKNKPLEINISRARMLQAIQEKEIVLWVDLEDPNEFESDTLVEIFNFHPLAVEDCVSDLSQPKLDDYEEYLFLVMHSVHLKPDNGLTATELDVFLGKNYVVTFHKEGAKSIEQVRELVQKKPDTFMGHGADLLMHTILDHLVDNYTPVLDHYDKRMDSIEEEMFNNPSKNYLAMVLQVKRDIFQLRRIVVPQRDTLNFLTRNPTAFIKPKHMMYFRDVYDHLFRVYGIVEGLHEMIPSVLQVYFSHSSHTLNEVMKRMTILATLSMPVVMIASIYGMNFKFMPELDWQYGYFLSLGLMFLVSIIMLIWMKFKKWI